MTVSSSSTLRASPVTPPVPRRRDPSRPHRRQRLGQVRASTASGVRRDHRRGRHMNIFLPIPRPLGGPRRCRVARLVLRVQRLPDHLPAAQGADQGRGNSRDRRSTAAARCDCFRRCCSAMIACTPSTPTSSSLPVAPGANLAAVGRLLRLELAVGVSHTNFFGGPDLRGTQAHVVALLRGAVLPGLALGGHLLPGPPHPAADRGHRDADHHLSLITIHR